MAEPQTTLDDATTAIMAHGLMSSLGIVLGSARALRCHWEELGHEPATARRLLERIERHAELVAGVLGELARGLPTEVASDLGPTIHLP